MKRLMGILNELHPETVFSADTRLIEDRILDSLDIVTLVTDINEAYGLELGADDIIPENFATVGAVMSLISRRGGEICG